MLEPRAPTEDKARRAPRIPESKPGAAIGRFGVLKSCMLATASGIDGLELVRDMGADATVDARHDDIAEAARRFAPNGVDAVPAFAGGEEFEHALEALRPGGWLAYPNGIEPEPKKGRGIM